MSHLLLGWCLRLRPRSLDAVRGALDSPCRFAIADSNAVDCRLDVLYACQDYEFDVKEDSIRFPKRLGIARALLIARGLPIGAFAATGCFNWITDLAFSR